MIDYLGLYLVLTRVLGKGEMKIVITATGQAYIHVHTWIQYFITIDAVNFL